MPTDTAPSPPRLRIAVLGAGSIGCHLGGTLAAVADVTLIGRPAAMDEIERLGLTLTGPAEARREIRDLTLATDAAAAAGADWVLVTVKSDDTAAAARDLAGHLAPGTVVASFQNGLHNPRVLRAGLPGRRVLAGMVPYNVVRTGPAAFHQGSAGQVMLDAGGPAAGGGSDGDALAAAAAAAGLRLALRRDMAAVQAAKLLMNLNNAVNALSGLPLREQLGGRAYRACLARCQREALAAFRAAGLRPARLGPVPPGWTPAVLGLPDALFRRLAGASLRIDGQARSSMWEDLQRGRTTEIGSLQGEIVTLAGESGLAAPANARLVELVREAERAAPGTARRWSGPDLLAELAGAVG
ncbi:2-dehydropantoate 2-reductase [Kitasatospora herbaricolor]|uniref:2-dehydropantoate 2-reductase n=1 Tax=Kitasatospora herbaricolor TaxID=68217 RepID=UPI0019CBCD97|nr:2-dehydropantoate 2-reductase [Kitasatospora herbaricolor]MDQ0306378.1 2-dehydropantoate 2-reductase [Kitasatospora herbaricolor]GGV44039.1 2-dehydropantoate 2-reductase [Kitasatospora herbaricolor]